MSGAEAVAAADALGYPVVLELTAGAAGDDGEGGRLCAADAAAVRRAFQTLELVERAHFGAGVSRITVRQLSPPGEVQLALSCESHPELGPVIRLERAWRVSAGNPAEPGRPWRAAPALAPLAPSTARQLAEQCSAPADASPVREGFDQAALERFLLRFSRLVTDQPAIKEIRITPLRVSARGVAADAASVVLREPPADERPSQPPAAPVAAEAKAALAAGCS